MTNFINKFKLPTILGLGIIFLGLASGLYLVLKEQTFVSQAAPNLTPQNITFTNITQDSVVISWQTNSPAASFVTFGQNNPGEQTALDDRDTNGPKPHLNHYATLKNLLPQTRYQLKIVANKINSDVQSFETAKPLTNKAGSSPIIGSVLDNSAPVNDGMVYLVVQGAVTQSALMKAGGNFLIPLSDIRKTDLSDVYPLTANTIAKLVVVSEKGSASLIFKLKATSNPLAPIKLGQNVDLTTSEETPAPSPTTTDLNKYDLNNDGKINSADNAIILQNFGKDVRSSTAYKKADINGDGVVNQKDLDLMSQKLTELGSQ